MPTLRFADHFTPTERKILSRTFHQNCRDLGITHRDASIDIRRVRMPSSSHLGAICRPEPDRYILHINEANDMMRSIFAIGHEMVHFDQHTRGDLKDDHRNQIVYWKGKSFPAWFTESREHYNSLPWEQEAAAKQDKLMDSAMNCLLPHERAFVCNTALAA